MGRRPPATVNDRQGNSMNLVEKAISLVIGTKHERDFKRMKPMVDDDQRASNPRSRP